MHPAPENENWNNSDSRNETSIFDPAFEEVKPISWDFFTFLVPSATIAAVSLLMIVVEKGTTGKIPDPVYFPEFPRLVGVLRLFLYIGALALPGAIVDLIRNIWWCRGTDEDKTEKQEDRGKRENGLLPLLFNRFFFTVFNPVCFVIFSLLDYYVFGMFLNPYLFENPDRIYSGLGAILFQMFLLGLFFDFIRWLVRWGIGVWEDRAAFGRERGSGEQVNR